jgi:hypothetical protein
MVLANLVYKSSEDVRTFHDLERRDRAKNPQSSDHPSTLHPGAERNPLSEIHLAHCSPRLKIAP